MIDPLTLGIGAIGSGLILLGANAALRLKGLGAKADNTFFAIIAIAWGLLDQARRMLAQPAGISFALLLLVIGLAVMLTPLFVHPSLESGDPAGDV